MNNSLKSLKKELEATSSQFWNIDPNAGELLQSLIFTHQPKHILEIGTSNGYSAILMAEIASKYGGHITTIEFFEERVQLAEENLARAGLSKTVTVLQGDATDLLPKLVEEQKKYNFFFLDANKEEHALYFTHAMKLISPNGIIVADNTISHRKKLGEFFRAVENEPRTTALELSIGTGLMIIQVA